MPEYRCQFIDKNNNKPSRGIQAPDDAGAFKRRNEIVEKENMTYVEGSMQTSDLGRGFRKVPDPKEDQVIQHKPTVVLPSGEQLPHKISFQN